MIPYILLIISLAGAVTKNLIPKAGGKEFSTLNGLMTVNIMSGIAGMIICGFSGLSIKSADSLCLIILALIYGLFTLSMQSFYMTAAERGSVSVCSLIYASSFVIQTVFSAVYSGEKCSALNICGILVMIAALTMVSLKDLGGKRGSRISIILAVISMIFASGVGIVQKIFAHIYGGQGQTEFTLCVAVVNKLNVILITVMPGVLYFPVYAAGTVLCSAICSRVIFKENLTRLQWAGIACGVTAIVMIVI